MKRIHLDREELSKVFGYAPETGRLFFLNQTRNNRRKAGQEVGHKRTDGYLCTSFKGRRHLCHVLIWFLMGETLDDKEVVDHINGEKSDNRWSNLRKLPKYKNNLSSKLGRSKSTSGITGVSYNSKFKKWEAFISRNNQHRFLGYTRDMVEAAALRLAAEQCLMGHSPHNSLAKTTIENYVSSNGNGFEMLCEVDRKINRNNTSGHRGVIFNQSNRKWVAQIKVKRKNHTIYYGNSKEEACLHRLAAEQCLSLEEKLP